jgi:alkylation response protein AidB-like acyl-CoA dehydrogenase
MERTIFGPDHLLFRESVRRFAAKEIVPNLEHWTQNGIVSRDIWKKAGDNGLLAMAVPEQFGGAGQDDFLYNVIVAARTNPKAGKKQRLQLARR